MAVWGDGTGRSLLTPLPPPPPWGLGEDIKRQLPQYLRGISSNPSHPLGSWQLASNPNAPGYGMGEHSLYPPSHSGSWGQPKSHPPAKFRGAVVRPKPVPPWLGGDISPNPGHIAPWRRGYNPSPGCEAAAPGAPRNVRAQPQDTAPSPTLQGPFPPPQEGTWQGGRSLLTPPSPLPISLPLLILGKQQKGEEKNSNFS